MKLCKKIEHIYWTRSFKLVVIEGTPSFFVNGASTNISYHLMDHEINVIGVEVNY